MEIYSSEEQQVEAIKRFWQEYGKSIVGGVVIGLAALYGFRFYQSEQRSGAEQASARYDQLVQQRETAASEDWLAQAQGFIASAKDSNYAVLAALMAAKEAVDAKNYTVATEQLSWVLSQSKTPAVLAITRIRLAKVQQEQGDFDAALQTLEAQLPASFTSMQTELKGDILLQAGKLAEAKAAYEQAMTTAGQNQQLLQIKLDELAHITAA